MWVPITPTWLNGIGPKPSHQLVHIKISSQSWVSFLWKIKVPCVLTCLQTHLWKWDIAPFVWPLQKIGKMMRNPWIYPPMNQDPWKIHGSLPGVSLWGLPSRSKNWRRVGYFHPFQPHPNRPGCTHWPCSLVAAGGEKKIHGDPGLTGPVQVSMALYGSMTGLFA